MQAAANFVDCALCHKWPFQEAPSQQLKYFLQLATFRFARVAVDFQGVSQLFKLTRSEVTSPFATWPRTHEEQGTILVPLDIILARLDTTQVWAAAQCLKVIPH